MPPHHEPCTDERPLRGFTLQRGLLFALATESLASARGLYNQGVIGHDLDQHQIRRDIKPDAEYEWLEPPFDPDALAWAQNETERTVAHLDALPLTAEVLDTVTGLARSVPEPPTYSISGGRIFGLRHGDDNPSGLLEVTQRRDDGTLDDWELVLDIDALGEAMDRTFEFHRGQYLADGNASRYIAELGVGGNTLQLQEIDLATGQPVPGGFNTGQGFNFFAWLDVDHLLISQTATPDSPLTAAGYPAAWQLWERGTPLSEAEEIMRVGETSLVAFTHPLGESGSGYGLLMEFAGLAAVRFHVLSPGGKVEKVTSLPETVLLRFDIVTTARHLIVVLTAEATVAGRTLPEGTVLAYDFKSCAADQVDRTSVVWVPGPEEFNPFALQYGLSASRSRVHMTTTSHGVERRLAFEHSDGAWELVEEVESAAGGLVELRAGDRASDDIIIVETGLIIPPVTSLLSVEGERTVLFEQVEYFNGSDFIAEPMTAESSDGTIIDHVLVRPRSFEHHNSTAGRRSVLMHGYGGFGTSLSLEYLDYHLVPWLEAGGSVDYAFIRGGGERGLDWHQQAQGPRNRQLAWDDFIAVAEHLVSSGFTSPANLGAYGHSNGGLLVGVMATQRPDLFGAIVSDAPVLDALRFVEMSPTGVVWVEEFGNPADPEDAEIIRTWSPFHLVREDVEYPPFLTTVANADESTGPGHPRKMIAKMRDAGVDNAFLYVVEEGGHFLIRTRINPVLMAHRTAFFMHYLMD